VFGVEIAFPTQTLHLRRGARATAPAADGESSEENGE
jgi:hypothetical protein